MLEVPDCYEKGDWQVGSTRMLWEEVRRVTERLEVPPECYEKGKKGDWKVGSTTRMLWEGWLNFEAPPECYEKGKKDDWKVGSTTRMLCEG